MTDRPVDETEAAGEHPDEGLIHAWLDQALDAAESERLAAHVRECPVCQERVAEARGLIAGASRIVAALDDVPAGARAGWAQSAASGAAPAAAAAPADGTKPLPDRSLWRWLRVTPGRAALAATILVALGITLTQGRIADDSAKPMTSVLEPQRADAPTFDSGAAAALPGGERVAGRDALLDSAVARNLEMAQGRRVLKAAPGQPLPQAPPAPSPAAPADLDSRAVAEGRAESQARREITGAVAADRARVGVARDEPVAGVALGGPSAATQPTIAMQKAGVAEMSRQVGNAGARSCLRLDSSEPGSSWGEQPFPLVVAVDPGPATGPRGIAVLTSAGEPTSLRGSWSELGGDSISITLRRIGYSGSIVLGPDDGVRTGVAVSGPYTPPLQGMAAAGQARDRTDGARAAESRRAAPSGAAAPAREQAPPAAAEAGPPVRRLRVTAHPIACPAG
jgi:hypothetical protein